ncbi:molybdopterin molybdotransferase MoeA, partial [uncultured Helicobacter sp.]
MADYPTLISYDEAVKILNTLPIKPLGTQQVHFKNALHRICAEDITAPCDVPSYPTSAMDGYAINFEDMPTLLTNGLEILPPNKAGNPNRPTLQRGYTIKTLTGSLLPINADTLIIVEHITLKDNRIFLNTSADNIKPHQWIRQAGDNYKKGEVLLKKGDKIGAFEIGLLAELNQNFLQVYQKARVGILCVGDEIIEVGEEKKYENVVRSVNPHLLESILLQMGQEPMVYPLLKDDKAMIKAAYERALRECDMIISTGGMSMGDYDFTQDVIKEMGQIHFKGVRLKPGKPVA